MFVGQRVAKHFEGYCGTVQFAWYDEKLGSPTIGLPFWRVNFDDGDEEDMRESDVQGAISLYTDASSSSEYSERGDTSQLVCVVNPMMKKLFFSITRTRKVWNVMSEYSVRKRVYVGSLLFRYGDIALTGDETLEDLLGEDEVECVTISAQLK